MTPRRILLLITDLQIGGTPTVVRELALRLHDPPKVLVDVACLATWGPVAGDLALKGIRVHALGATGPASVGIIPSLIRLIRDGTDPLSRYFGGGLGRVTSNVAPNHTRSGGDDDAHVPYDTVFSFLVHANVVAAVASRACPGVRWIQSIQTTQPTPRWHWWAQAAAQFAAQCVVVPSPSVAQAARDWAGVPAERIEVIPNAIDANTFVPLRGAQHPGTPGFITDGCDGPLTYRSPVQRVGFIGRLDPIKRIGDLIAAMTLLPATVELHIFGEGSERPRLQRLIRNLKLSSRVILRGTVIDPREALAQMDVLVLCSAAEGFGLVLIEAMAVGVPVIGTNVPGIRDVIRDGVTGLLIPPASPPLLAQAIASLLNEPYRCDQLREHARVDVIDCFSWDRVLPQYRAVLNIDDA